MTDKVNKPNIVIIGAGATGRGHIGQLAHDAGFNITFIERRKDLVDCLKAAGKYTVGLAGETITNLTVNNFQIFHTDESENCAQAISDADIIATAVLPTNLESTVPTLSSGLKLRMKNQVEKPLNIIAAENMERSSSTLREYLKAKNSDLDWNWIDAHVGFPDSMVARAVPIPKDPLVLLAEYTQEWSVDATKIKQPMPHFEGMTLSENQNAALERKLYIKNTGHVSIGVLGYLKGYELMDEAARDPEIFSLIEAATKESAAAVIAKYKFDPSFIEEYRSSFVEAMKSPFLPDEIKRVIREPIRKLSREERLIGPAMLCIEYGIEPKALAKIIAKTFTLRVSDDPQSIELQARLKSEGILAAIKEICGIPESHPLTKLIIDSFQIQNDLHCPV